MKAKLFGVLSLCWMVVIFILSGQTAEKSTDVSDAVTHIVVETIYGNETPRTAEEVGWEGSTESINEDIKEGRVPKDDLFGTNRFNFKNTIRKMAHFSLFCVLSLFVCLTFLFYRGEHPYLRMLVGVGVCVAYAFLDEFHQMFVPGRGASLNDVGLDCFGIAIGFAFVVSVRLIINLVKRKWGILKNSQIEKE